MEPPYKRRKTSPIPSGKASNKTSARRSASHNGDSLPSKRALFMSPTRASLARFNPRLLQPNDRIIAWQRNKEDLDVFGNPHTNAEGNGTLHQYASTVQSSSGVAEMTSTLLKNIDMPILSAQQEDSPAIAGQDSGNSVEATLHTTEGPRVSPPKLAKNGHGDSSQFGVENDGPGGDHDAAVSHLPGRHVATEAATGERVPLMPTLPTKVGSISGMGLGEDGEPSLPSTPAHLGLEKLPKPPRGLSSRPNSKEHRRRGFASLRSSPLKENGVQPAAEDPLNSHPLGPGLGARVYIAKTPKPPLSPQGLNLANTKERLGRLEEQLQNLEDDLLRQALVSNCVGTIGGVTKNITQIEKETVSISARVIRLRDEVRQMELTNGSCKDGTLGIEGRMGNQSIRQSVT